MYSASSSESLQSCRYKRGLVVDNHFHHRKGLQEAWANIKQLSIVAELLNSILPDSSAIRAGRSRIPRLLNHCETYGSVCYVVFLTMQLMLISSEVSQEKQNKTGGWTFSSEEDHQSGGSDGGD